MSAKNVNTTPSILLHKHFTVFLLACSLVTLFGAEEAFGASVNIDLNSTHQTIDGMGLNIPWGYKIYPQYTEDATAHYVMDNLKPTHVRIFNPRHTSNDPLWEGSGNDNSDPNALNGSVFVNSGIAHDRLVFAKEMQDKGIPIVYSHVNMPSFVYDSQITWGHFSPSKYAEAAEAMAAFLVKAKEHYNVDIHYVSLNEPSWSASGSQIILSASELRDFIKVSGARFAQLKAEGKLSVDVKWLVGDTHTAAYLPDYATTILADPIARQYTGPLSFHSYYSWDTSTLSAIKNIAKSYGRKVWVEEGGVSSSGAPTTWGEAMLIAQMYHSVMKYAEASVIDHWDGSATPIGGIVWGVVNPSTLQPYPVFYVLKQFIDAWQPGTVMVEATSDDNQLLVLAGKDTGHNKLSIQIINSSSQSKSVTISGIPNGNYTLMRTRQSENAITLPNSFTSANNALTVIVPPESISLFAGNLGGGNTPPPPPPTTTYSVSVSKSGSGSGTVSIGNTHVCGSQCSSTVTAGTSLSLNALPSTDSYFAGWGGDCSGNSLDCTLQVNRNMQVSATFELSNPNVGPNCVSYMGTLSYPNLASPCPVFSVSAGTVNGNENITLNLKRENDTTYFYNYIYISDCDSTSCHWNKVRLVTSGVGEYFQDNLVDWPLSLSGYQTGTHYILAWEWVYDANRSCYTGPASTACNDGKWRIQKVVVN